MRRMQKETYLTQKVKCDECHNVESRLNTLIVKVSLPSNPIVIGGMKLEGRRQIKDRRLCRKCLGKHMAWEANKKGLDSDKKDKVAKMSKNIWDGA
jgi:hypothetical protein